MSQFQLRAYTGKETGLMVIGTANDYRALADQLVQAAETADNPAATFPPLIHTLSAIGPYTDRTDFELSFHLTGPATLEEAMPLTRASLPTWIFLGVAVLSLLGAVTVVRWVAGFAA